MKRTTLAVALATGALAVPGVALATGDGGSAQQEPSTAPVQQQDDQQRPDRDCPKGEGRGGGDNETTQL